jgi:hypothetical protein
MTPSGVRDFGRRDDAEQDRVGLDAAAVLPPALATVQMGHVARMTQVAEHAMPYAPDIAVLPLAVYTSMLPTGTMACVSWMSPIPSTRSTWPTPTR